MLNTIKKLLALGGGHENLITPADIEAEFRLDWRDLNVGCLKLEKGTWTFWYSEEFRDQSDVAPLVDFPNIEKKYVSESLWPFFSIRIPSLEQPAVRRVINEEQLDEKNEVQLLKRFGQNTITNPFSLKEAL